MKKAIVIVLAAAVFLLLTAFVEAAPLEMDTLDGTADLVGTGSQAVTDGKHDYNFTIGTDSTYVAIYPDGTIAGAATPAATSRMGMTGAMNSYTEYNGLAAITLRSLREPGQFSALLFLVALLLGAIGAANLFSPRSDWHIASARRNDAAELSAAAIAAGRVAGVLLILAAVAIGIIAL